MAGSDVRVDYRSYEEQGHGLLPTKKLCRAEIEMKKRGIPIAKDERNKEIRAINQERQELLQHKTAEWEAATQMVRGLAAVATKKWEMSKTREALEHTFTTWIEQVKATVKDELLAHQREIQRQGAVSERGKAEAKTVVQPVSGEKEYLSQDDTLQHQQAASRRKKHKAFAPNGWRVKTGKDWPSVRKLRLEQSADEQYRTQLECVIQQEAHKAPNVNFEVQRAAEKVRLQQDTPAGAALQSYHRAKRELFQPNGWKMKAQKDWQSLRKRFVEKTADEYPRQPREQQQHVTREAEQERMPQADTLQREQQVSHRKKRESWKPTGWRVKTQKDWPSTRARLKEQSALFEQEQQKTGVHKAATLSHQREMGEHAVQEVSQRRNGSIGEWRAHPETRELLAPLKEERQEERSHHHTAWRKEAQDSCIALLSSILEKVAATRTPQTSLQVVPESIIEQIADLHPEKEEETRRHHAVFQRLTSWHHDRTEREEERSLSYAEEEWNRSETRRRYNAGRRSVPRREGIGEKAHRAVQAFQNKRLEQGRREQQRKESVLQEYVRFEHLLDTPSPEETPYSNIHHAHAVSRRPRGREMEGGP